MSHSAARPAIRPTGQDDDRQYQRQSGPVGALQAVGLGVLAGLIGLAPWMVTGMQLPLQNLWAVITLPEEMPLTALPLSQYLATTLVALIVTGGLVAGLAVRWWAPAQRTRALLCAAAGLLLTQLAAAVQSFAVLDAGLLPGRLSGLYLGGLLMGVLASIAAAVLVVLAVGSRQAALVAVGVAAAAVPAGTWLLGWAAEPFSGADLPPALYLLDNWFPALLIGAVLAWCGAGTVRRRAVWPLSLGILWLLPPLFGGVSYALGSRVLRGDLVQMLDAGTDVFVSGVVRPEVWVPVLVAAGIGAAGVLARRLAAGRTAAAGKSAAGSR